MQEFWYIKIGLQETCFSALQINLRRLLWSPHLRKSWRQSWVLESTPWISDSSYSIPDHVTGFLGLNFGFQSTGFPILETKISWIPQAKMETGFEKGSRSTFCSPYITYLPKHRLTIAKIFHLLLWVFQAKLFSSNISTLTIQLF